MASAQGIKAGSAFVELLLNDEKLVKGLQKASKKLKAFGASIAGWGQTLAGIGTAIAAPMLGASKVFSEMGDQIAKMSQRTGVSVETLSELGYAAQLSGSDLQTLEGSLRKMQKTVVAAASGSQEAVDTLAQLGLTVEDLRGLTPDQQFKLIADKLAAVQSPALKAALAMRVFGKSGTQLLPMMADGAKGIEALQQQARDLGLTMSTEDARAAEALNDSFDTLWKVLKQGVFLIGSALAPTIRSIAEWIIQTAVAVNRWIKQNKDLIVTIFKVSLGVIAAGLALLVLGKAIVFVGGVFAVLATTVSVVATVIGGLGSIFGWLLSPIGLVVAAVVGLAAYLLYASGAGGQALAWLGDRFTDLSEFATQAFQGIADALLAGDIALAAKILWLTLRIAWIKGVQVLESAWLSFKNFFIKTGYDAFYGVQAVWEIVGNALMVAWIETTAFLSKVWTRFTGGFQQAWNSAINWTTKRLLELQGLLDSSFDVEAAKQMADQNLEATNAQIDRQTQAALDAREQKRSDERKAAQQIHEQEMARIGQESIDAQNQLDAEAQKKIDAAQSDLDAAKQEWQDAIGQARNQRQSKDAQGPERLKAPAGIADYLEGLGSTVQQAQQKTVGVHGTFNAMEAPGMRAGGAWDRMTKAAEETAKNTKKLVAQGEQDDQEFD